MKTRIVIYLAIVTIMLTVISVFVYFQQDHTAPEIDVPAGDITYVAGQDDDAVLLQGVKARDDNDGDLSSDIRIYDIAVLENGRQALVTYAVYDKSNNLGKATRMVSYEAIKPEQKKTEEDKKEEESTEEAKKDEKEEVTEEPTTEEVTEAAVPDGYEDPEMVSTGAPVLKLTTHEVHIEVGGDFYTMDYVEDAVDDKDTKDYLYDNMFLDSVYDKSKAGTYELIYFCVDSDGNRSNSAKLKLYVE